MDVETIAQAIEADAGRALPGLRASRQQTRAGKFSHIHKTEPILARAARNKLGTEEGRGLR